MSLEMRQLRATDGDDIYEMLQELPYKENGFTNTAHGLSKEEFQEWLRKAEALSHETGVVDGKASETMYWLYEDGIPVGVGRFRHVLTDDLRIAGGNIGYAIRTYARNRGLGTKFLGMLKEEAKKGGLTQVLITVQNHNIPSMKVVEANGGKLEKITDTRHYYWIQI